MVNNKQEDSVVENITVDDMRNSRVTIGSNIIQIRGLAVTGRSAVVSGLIFGLSFGVLNGLIYGLFSGLIFSLSIWLSGRQVNISNEAANEMLWNNVAIGKNIVQISGLIINEIGGLLIGLLSGLVFGLVFRVLGPLAFGLVIGMSGELAFGPIRWLIFGGTKSLQHITLRTLLWLYNLAPLNYALFLDYCHQRILLRKVGGGYIFVHRLLLEHFAAMTEEDIERLSSSAK
jgi:hypothetical protein